MGLNQFCVWLASRPHLITIRTCVLQPTLLHTHTHTHTQTNPPRVALPNPSLPVTVRLTVTILCSPTQPTTWSSREARGRRERYECGVTLRGGNVRVKSLLMAQSCHCAVDSYTYMYAANYVQMYRNHLDSSLASIYGQLSFSCTSTSLCISVTEDRVLRTFMGDMIGGFNLSTKSRAHNAHPLPHSTPPPLCPHLYSLPLITI